MKWVGTGFGKRKRWLFENLWMSGRSLDVIKDVQLVWERSQSSVGIILAARECMSVSDVDLDHVRKASSRLLDTSTQEYRRCGGRCPCKRGGKHFRQNNVDVKKAACKRVRRKENTTVHTWSEMNVQQECVSQC